MTCLLECCCLSKTEREGGFQFPKEITRMAQGCTLVIQATWEAEEKHEQEISLETTSRPCLKANNNNKQ